MKGNRFLLNRFIFFGFYSKIFSTVILDVSMKSFQLWIFKLYNKKTWTEIWFQTRFETMKRRILRTVHVPSDRLWCHPPTSLQSGTLSWDGRVQHKFIDVWKRNKDHARQCVHRHWVLCFDYWFCNGAPQTDMDPFYVWRSLSIVGCWWTAALQVSTDSRKVKPRRAHVGH